MSLISTAKSFAHVVNNFARQPWESFRLLHHIVPTTRGYNYSQRWESQAQNDGTLPHQRDCVTKPSNPLREYFDSHCKGPGIWKWEHYFDIYNRHFSKFVDREVYVLEIGVFSGGSLGMWKKYFGPKCRIIGIDIQEECKAYEDSQTKILIGDQADRDFWKRVRDEVPVLDVVIDDGGHLPKQQIVTVEELLPHLRYGGVYLCEDVLEPFNRYSAYLYGMTDNLHGANYVQPDGSDTARPILVKPNKFQRDIHSIHIYPFVTVIEKADTPVEMLVSRKRGTEWQPFLEKVIKVDSAESTDQD